MTLHDPFEVIVHDYELRTGPAPKRESLMTALRQTASEEEIRVLLLLPTAGPLDAEKLIHKAERRLGIVREDLEPVLDHLLHEALVLRYTGKAGRVYERASPVHMTEQQVRMRKGTPLGQLYAQYWHDIFTVSLPNMPIRTPQFRVMAVEETIARQGERHVIQVNANIPDTRETLPIDIVSAMIRNQSLIAVAECYCRLAQGMLGSPCSYPRETCFTFNELAEPLLEIGLARRVDIDEALTILLNAEKAGLIHNVDNCEDHMRVLCNCCPCCCAAVKAFDRGLRNIDAPSRFESVFDPALCTQCEACVPRCPTHAIRLDHDTPVFDQERCIGCGQCASTCPTQAVYMAARSNPPRPEPTRSALKAKIRRETRVGMITDRLSR
jgi:Pyruvate/2-oxoacid:ferredoxin oxidoreductase delta subunit